MKNQVQLTRNAKVGTLIILIAELQDSREFRSFSIAFQDTALDMPREFSYFPEFLFAFFEYPDRQLPSQVFTISNL